MKKNLFLVICTLLSLTAARADILTPSYNGVEIGGFIYDLNDFDDDGYGSGIVTNITDEKFAEVNENRELKFPSTIEYDGRTFTIFSVSESLWERKIFNNVEYVELPEDIESIGISNMPNLREISGLESVSVVLPNGLCDLPSVKSLGFSVNNRLQLYSNSFANVGVERLEISVDDLSMNGTEQSVYDLPELTDLHIGYLGKLRRYCFYNLPKLKTITIDNVSDNRIGAYCFYNLPQLERLTIKKLNGGLGMTRGTFLNTPLLSNVYVEDSNPGTLYCEMEKDGFYPPRMTLHVPVGSRELYAEADGWKEFGEIVEYDPAGVASPEADAVQPWSCTPAAGGLTVSADSAVTVEVVTPAGAVVKRVAVAAGETVTVELPAGVYIVAGPGQSAKVCVR